MLNVDSVEKPHVLRRQFAPADHGCSSLINSFNTDVSLSRSPDSHLSRNFMMVLFVSPVHLWRLHFGWFQAAFFVLSLSICHASRRIHRLALIAAPNM